MLDFTGRAKWDAWDRQGAEEGMDAAAAQAAYVELARDRFDFRIDNDDDDDSMQRGGGAKSGSTESVQRKRQPKKEQMVGVSMMADDFVDEAYVPDQRLLDCSVRCRLASSPLQTALQNTRACSRRRRHCPRGFPRQEQQ